MEDKLKSPAMFIGVQGDGIISFGSGQPDLPPPDNVFDILKDFKLFKYGLIPGQADLREALSREYDGCRAEDFVVTNGASEALDLTFRVIGSGKVLMHRPYYYSYPYNVLYAGMTPKYTDTIKGRIDIDDFDEKVRDCKAVLINSPSNPTGRIQPIKTLKEIEKITKDLGVYLISDEVYKDLIYERENYFLKGPHVITINSFSKTYSMCGLRVGYLWSNDSKFVQDVVEYKTHTSMNTSIIGQAMAFEALKTPKSFIKKQLDIWRERRDLIFQGLCDLGLDLWKPEGAFYVFPKVPNPRKTLWSLYEGYKTITYLGEWFGDPDRIRLSYALDTEKIEEGLKRLGKCLER